MNSLITVLSILAPLFIGFCIRLPQSFLMIVDKILSLIIYLILILIGISLSRVDNLGIQMPMIIGSTVLLFVCVIGMNLVTLIWFDRRYPYYVEGGGRKTSISIMGSVKQVGCVCLGFILGLLLHSVWLPPENLGTYFLMVLVLLVGVQLRSAGIPLRQVLINRRGIQVFIFITLSSLCGGLLFAVFIPEVSWSKGLALASGFGWYSLSGIVMTEAYGAVWGSVALLNDLAREFFAFVFIPVIMRRYPSTAVGVGGATSLDFTLPIIQSAGGLAIVPLAISFGFVINIVAPILMVVFSSLHF